MVPYLMKVAFLGLLIPTLVAHAIVNSKIDRIIDLSSQLVKIIEKINLEQASQLYSIKLDANHLDRLAFLQAKINGVLLDVVQKEDGLFEIHLGSEDATKHQIVVTTIYTKLAEPYPAEITQSERQLVRYRGTLTTISPYITRTISTRIKLPSSTRLESFTKSNKMTTGTNKLTYGPYKDVPAFSSEPLTIHLENNSPFVAVKYLNRRIEVSPWSRSIDVVNDVKVEHVGARLKGPFSRFEYQRDNSNGISSVRNFNTDLPKFANSIFFRDGIGNISTSSIRKTSSKTIVSIRPRFPLFGGWVTDFLLGYTLPLNEYVQGPNNGNRYTLTIPFADLLYENMFVEDAKIKIVLPAGASSIKVDDPIKADRLPDEFSYSYLDVIGRPVLTLSKKNLVAPHLLESSPIRIRYNYSPLFMAQEPALLFGVGVTCLLALVAQKVLSRLVG